MAGRAPASSSPGSSHCTMASAATAAHQQRLLRALSYPFDYASDGDAASLATLVTWCEDRKIRALEIDDRAPLRVAGERWDGAFAAHGPCPREEGHFQTEGHSRNCYESITQF